MMNTPARQARLELRMTQEQKSQIEEAAEAQEMTVAAWALDRLMASALRDIEEARTVALSEEAFTEFEMLLDQDEEELVHSELGSTY